jgi:hypothetical protein
LQHAAQRAIDKSVPATQVRPQIRRVLPAVSVRQGEGRPVRAPSHCRGRTAASLGVIAGIVLVAIAASWMFPKPAQAK